MNLQAVSHVNVGAVGAYSCGKSSILQRLHDDTFFADTRHPQDDSIKKKKLQVYGRIIHLRLIDTRGVERFHFGQTRTILRTAEIILFVFDVSDKESFEQIQTIILEAPKHRPQDQNPPCVKALVGTKIDLPLRVVSREDAVQLATDHSIPHYFEVSSKTGENILEMFKQLSEQYEFPKQEEAEQKLESLRNEKALYFSRFPPEIMQMLVRHALSREVLSEIALERKRQQREKEKCVLS